MSTMASMMEAHICISLTGTNVTLSLDDGVESLLGFGRDDFMSGKVSLEDRFHLGDRDIAAKLFAPNLNSAAGTVNFRLREANGHIRCVAGRYAKRLGETTDEIVLDLLLQDARSLWHQRGVETLSANFMAMMESTDDFIYFKDRNHVFTGASQTLVSVTDPSEHWTDLLGKTDYDVFPEKYADLYYELEKQVFSGFAVAHEIQETLDTLGNKGWVDNRKYPIRDEHGEISGLFGIARIVTHQVLAEQALRESEETLRESQVIAGLGSYVVDISSGVWKGTTVLDQLFGIDADYEHTLQGWAALIHPGDRTAVEELFRQEVLGKGRIFHKEFRIIRHSDHAERWVRGIGRLERDAQERPARLRGTVQDITESRQELRTQQRAILGNRMIGVVATRNESVVWANAAFEAMLGYGPGELANVPKRLFCMDDENCRAMLRNSKDTDDSNDSDEVVHAQQKLLGKGGFPIWVDMSVARLSRESDEFLWTIIDITKSRDADIARQSYARYARSLLEASLDPLVTISIDGKITDVNTATERVTGVDRSSLVNSDFADYFTDMARARQGYQKAFSEGFVTDYPLCIRHISGRATNVTYNASVYKDVNGQVIGVFAAARDVTQRLQAEIALKQSNSLLNSLLDALPVPVFYKDSHGRYLGVNPAFEKFFGQTSDELRGKSVFDISPPELAKIYHAQDLELSRHQGIQIYESQVKNSDGDLRNVIFHKAYFGVDAESGEGGLIGAILDITERKQAEEELELAASVFVHAREGIIITSADGSILDVNDAFHSITGYCRDEVLGKNPRFLSSGRHGTDYYATMWGNLIEKGYWDGEIWNKRKNGEVYAGTLTISAVRDGHGTVRQYVALFSDITATKNYQEQLEHIAHFDALTSLPNRALLADRMRQAMSQAQRRGQPLAVAFLDLDGFKAINDRFGHDIGDQLLVALSERMRQALREGDTLARMGGDEFVALLLDLEDVAASMPMLTRLLTAASHPVQIGEHLIQVSASLGVTFFPQVLDVDAEQILRQADQAMYQAKLAGKNRFIIFDAKHDGSIRDHHENLSRIQVALANGEFVLHYQPKVNMHTGVVVGAEALIRWQHPERGLLPPSTFLPVIEDDPLAIGIGEWVMETALVQMDIWREAGMHIPVSVNIGSRQLQQPEFVERVRHILGRHPNVKAGDLELEVLETSAMEDVSQVSHVIQSCREMGVNFSLDDFGTGYSSLTYLKRLPVAVLKIDQSFVRDMLDDPDDLAILEGVLGLAVAFGRQVIAEGVETVAQGALLVQLGCELAQGFGIARPMPGSEMPEWAMSWRPDPSWVDLPSISRDDLPLLFAKIEHRAWSLAVEAFVTGERATPPALIHDCRFGNWLEGVGILKYGTRPDFQTINVLHTRLHEMGTKLCNLHVNGETTQACAMLRDLHDLRDAFSEQLRAILRSPRTRT